MAEYENIKFVQEIERHPCLYNHKLPDYIRKDVTLKTWAEVGKKFNMTAPEAKERWKNLRSVFVRHLKPLPNGLERRKPYYLSEYMQFTIPFIKAGVVVANSNENETCEEDSTELQPSEEYEQIQFIDCELSGDTATSTSQQQLTLSTQKSQAKSAQQPFVSPINVESIKQEFPSQQIIKRRRTETEDDDSETVDRDIAAYFKVKQSKVMEDIGSTSTENCNKWFLLSLLADMNKMSDGKVRLFKRKVLELVESIFDESTDTEK